MTDVHGMEKAVISLNGIFKFEVMGEGTDGRLFGKYRLGRTPPSFMERLSYFGLERAWKTAMDEAENDL